MLKRLSEGRNIRLPKKINARPYPKEESIDSSPTTSNNTSLGEFNHFLDQDVHLQAAHSTLRSLAIIIFITSILSMVIAVVDIEVSRQASYLVAINLQCNDTYLFGWTRHCQPLTDGINFTLPNGSNEANTSFFSRWFSSHIQYAYNYTAAGIALKILLTLLSCVNIYVLIVYNITQAKVVKMKSSQHQQPPCYKSPKLKKQVVEMLLGCFHIPPLCDAWLQYEIQLIVLLRVFIGSKMILKECNELRYNRLGNVLFKLAGVKIQSTFLIRSYFLHHPKTVLLIIYFIVVGIFSYFVMVTEKSHGDDLSYEDAAWLMMVTITNLGSGEVRPHGIMARTVVGVASMIGVLSTALWVNVFSKYLDLPVEEKRILTLIELQTCRKLERNAAATCIQAQWRRHLAFKKFGPEFPRKRIAADKKLKKALWKWKLARQNYTQLRRMLESRFTVEDTLMVAQNVDRRLSHQIKSESVVGLSKSKAFLERPSIAKPLQEIKTGLKKFRREFYASNTSVRPRENEGKEISPNRRHTSYATSRDNVHAAKRHSQISALHQQAVLHSAIEANSTNEFNQAGRNENQTSLHSSQTKHYQDVHDMHLFVEDIEEEDEDAGQSSTTVQTLESSTDGKFGEGLLSKQSSRHAVEQVSKVLIELTEVLETEKNRSDAFYQEAVEQLRYVETTLNSTDFAVDENPKDGFVERK